MLDRFYLLTRTINENVIWVHFNFEYNLKTNRNDNRIGV